jgi:iron-sulfur cluster repair protein YtfE (RIC family)
MSDVEQLTRAHQRLRAKLDALEAAFAVGADAWFVIREMSFSLSKQLREHLRTEGRLVASCPQALERSVAGKLARVALDHHEALQRLRVIREILKGEPCVSLDGIRPLVHAAAAVLRHSIARQEAELFPLLDRALVPREAASRRPGPRHVTDTMTLAEVMRRYPKTKAVFARCSISLPFEQYDPLDEVAWRHGMESQELLARLEEAITKGDGVDQSLTEEKPSTVIVRKKGE